MLHPWSMKTRFGSSRERGQAVTVSSNSLCTTMNAHRCRQSPRQDSMTLLIGIRRCLKVSQVVFLQAAGLCNLVCANTEC